MKKFIYLCGMMLITINIMAQIDLDDDNWECFINEDFSGNRSWSNLWEDQDLSDPNHVPIWICFTDNLWGDGVTSFDYEHRKYDGFHAYQRDNAVFGTDNTLKLKGEFVSHTPLHCTVDYAHAPWHKYCHYCDPYEEQHPQIHYYAGAIETIDPVGFGYYEIRCKMPIHNWDRSAFWFWSCLGGTYNEIDVFEHTLNLSGNNPARGTLSGIWYNPISTNYSDTSVGNVAIRFAHHLHTLPASSSTLDEYHTFGCLWMPERVVWYVDGEVVNECDHPSQIPQFPMWLKITHFQAKNVNIGTNDNPVVIEYDDEMTIDYVKAYRLKSDCDADVSLRNASDFTNFDYKVKRSITLGSLNGNMTLQNDGSHTLRAVRSITIDGGFEVPVGTSLTLMTQECPQCSMEGMVLPQHNCGMDDAAEKPETTNKQQIQ